MEYTLTDCPILQDHFTLSHSVRCAGRFPALPSMYRPNTGCHTAHWRFACSLACEACGSELTPSCTAGGQFKTIPAKLKVRAARGAQSLKSAYGNRSAMDARRVKFCRADCGQFGSRRQQNRSDFILPDAVIQSACSHWNERISALVKGGIGSS